MRVNSKDSFGCRQRIQVQDHAYTIFSLEALQRRGMVDLERLPYSIRVLLENVVRHEDGELLAKDTVAKVASYNPVEVETVEIPFRPARVLLQDFTGVPAVVDLAAMRDAVKSFGGDAAVINPLVRSDLVIDHSVQVDRAGTADAFVYNVRREVERNRERYSVLKWAQGSFRNFSVVPPGTGICHQVNLEYLAQVVMTKEEDGQTIAFPDTLVGLDSHTTMVNGLSVLAWGVGGIEAEAVMLGQPYFMLLPEVVGVRLAGALPAEATATDLVLAVTEMLRQHGVVGKFVEFFGPGLDCLTLPDRATIANMAPEYGATVGFFPIDAAVLRYLELTGRPQHLVALVERYAKEQHLFRDEHSPEPEYSAVLELDLSQVVPAVAGPRRPQDRIPVPQVQAAFRKALREIYDRQGEGAAPVPGGEAGRNNFQLADGAVVIAAITSCTNTSNPAVMVGAGLVAKKARELGLNTQPWVKTSLAPGSRVVTEYLEKGGLLRPLEDLGFHLVGYGCTTCIGNSGPLAEPVAKAIKEGNLVVAAVLSGNRNFEGRIHQAVKANYLASPPLVVAYALAGRIDIDFTREPLGTGSDGRPVFLRDVWPTKAEIEEMIDCCLEADQFERRYAEVFTGDDTWQSLAVEPGEFFRWDPESTYIKRPPFFDGMSLEKDPPQDIVAARVLAVLGDSITTDHISPAGAIPADSPAGEYLISNGVKVADFNSFGSRRGNHEVMIRGTFGNVRIKNLLLDGVEGGYTVHFPSGEQVSIFEAARRYQADDTPLLVIAGREYGTGSSRDWAAKGTALLGVKAVIAKSYERIHRSNLIGMGVLPLQFADGQGREELGLSGRETYDITGIAAGLEPGKRLTVTAVGAGGEEKRFEVITRLDSPIEVEYYEHGGILKYVLRRLLRGGLAQDA